MLAALPQKRDNEVFLVVKVAQEFPTELHVRIMEAGEFGVEGGSGVLRREHRVGALDDAANRRVQRVVVALEQLEAGREARLGASEHGKVVQVLDVVMLLEPAELPAQVLDQPRLEVHGLDPLLQCRLGAAPDDLVQAPEHVVALQPEARDAAELGVTRPGLARMQPRQNA